MAADPYQFPVAISRFSAGETSREPQNLRAIEWLVGQQGHSVVVVTPQKRFDSDSLRWLVSQPAVLHLGWRGLSSGSLAGRRVLHAWPDRQHLNDLWGVSADALAVIEWNEAEVAEWVEDAKPVQLLGERTIEAAPAKADPQLAKPLPNGVDGILEHVARMAAGYSSGLKWNEEDMLKADMMNRPDRWIPVSVAQVRGRCRELGMRPNDVDTVAGLLQRRKDGRRFNVRSSYRTFHFN